MPWKETQASRSKYIYIYFFFFRNCCLKCCVTFRLESSELIFQISPGCERKRVHIVLRNRVVALV